MAGRSLRLPAPKNTSPALCGLLAEALVDANEARRTATPWPLDPPVRQEAIRIRQAEIEAGPVSMGADFVTGAAAEEWSPPKEELTPPWLPEYPLGDGY